MVSVVLGSPHERFAGAEHPVELGPDLLGRVVELVDDGAVEGGADLDGAVVVGVGAREDPLFDVLLAHPVRLAGVEEAQPGGDLGPGFAALAEVRHGGGEEGSEVGDDGLLEGGDLTEAAVLPERVAYDPCVGGALEVGVPGEGLEDGAVAGVRGDRVLEGGVLVAGVDAEVVDGERGEGGVAPGLVLVGGGVGRVHGGQHPLDQAELMLPQARGAGGVQGFAQGVRVGPGDVEGAGGGGEGVDGAAYGVDGGGIGGVDLVVREVLVGHCVQIREHLVQMTAVLAVVGGGEAGDATGHGLDVGVGHDGDEPGVPRPDEVAQAVVGRDGRVGEEVREPLGAQAGDAVEGAGRDGGSLTVRRGGGFGLRARYAASLCHRARRRSRGGVELRCPGEALDLVEGVGRGSSGPVPGLLRRGPLCGVGRRVGCRLGRLDGRQGEGGGERRGQQDPARHTRM